jgi:hydroxymethylglutaryl-CoA synthase
MRVAQGWNEAARRINFAQALGDPVDLTEAQYLALHEGRSSDLVPLAAMGEFIVESIGAIDGPDFQNLGVEFYRYLPADR